MDKHGFQILFNNHLFLILLDSHGVLVLMDIHGFLILSDNHEFIILLDNHGFLILFAGRKVAWWATCAFSLAEACLKLSCVTILANKNQTHRRCDAVREHSRRAKLTGAKFACVLDAGNETTLGSRSWKP